MINKDTVFTITYLFKDGEKTLLFKKGEVPAKVSDEADACLCSSNEDEAEAIEKVLEKISLFKDADLILAIGEKPLEQFTEEFGFETNRVVLAHYPQDIDVNLRHSLRETSEIKSIIFPNRLTHSYNPIFALQPTLFAYLFAVIVKSLNALFLASSIDNSPNFLVNSSELTVYIGQHFKYSSITNPGSVPNNSWYDKRFLII